MLPTWFYYRTHCAVFGTTQSGKSKFAELCCRAHTKNGHGFAVLDYGTLADDLYDYLCYAQPHQSVTYLNLSNPESVTPWNPFALPKGADISAHAIHLTGLLGKIWGADDANELPQTALVSGWFEESALQFFRLLAITGWPIHHAAKILEFHRKDLRDYALSLLTEDDDVEYWKGLNAITSIRDWNFRVGALSAKLRRLTASKGLIRFFGTSGPGTDITKLIEDRGILLVNLRPSQYLPEQSARVAATLLLDQFLRAARERAGDPQDFYLYCDEAQNYLTTDAAQMLDEAAKAGLRCTLIFHHLQQKAFRDHPEIGDSLQMNAKIKVFFGGMKLAQAKEYAEEFFLSKINEEWIRREIWRTITKHRLEEFDSTTEGRASSNGRSTSTSSTKARSFSETYGDTTTTAESQAEGYGAGFSVHTLLNDDTTSSVLSMDNASNANSSGWSFSSSEMTGRSKADTQGSGESTSQTESNSVTKTTRYAPYDEKELASIESWSREDKIAKLCEPFMALKPQECIVKLPDRIVSGKVPQVDRHLLPPASVLRLGKALQPNAIPSDEADCSLKEQESSFLERSREYGNSRRSSARKDRKVRPLLDGE